MERCGRLYVVSYFLSPAPGAKTHSRLRHTPYLPILYYLGVSSLA